ncbi:MAG: GHKL domain-containing protein [Fibrobacter sp.]|jgi:signal transduction histidine kinase|nr:GHKL domain-containing protein [Fibrobacter sp.]
MFSSYTELEKKIDRLKAVYFSNPDKRIRFEKGKILVRQGELNKRLYLIISGEVAGNHFLHRDYGSHNPGASFEMFRGQAGTFVGVQSFFSQLYQSFSEIVAESDIEVAYIDTSTSAIEPEIYGSLFEQFVPVMLYELALRNYNLLEKQLEKEAAQTRMHRTEMNATLGQLAAGLAHELNNAIGVLDRKTNFISDFTEDTLRRYLPSEYRLYHYGKEEQPVVSTKELRRVSQKYEHDFGLSGSVARILALIAPSAEEFEKLPENFVKHLKKNYRFWELGHDIRDMLIAAKHAAGVVKSVKILGGYSGQRKSRFSLYDSLSQALSLLQQNLRNVSLELLLGKPEESPRMVGDEAELIQIWVNLIKNACDALTETPNATIRISLHTSEKQAEVRIEDNGPGIPDSLKSRVFHPDFTTKKEGLSFGLGLGLAIVQRLVTAYEGEISFESAPGKTIFKVNLPLENGE